MIRNARITLVRAVTRSERAPVHYRSALGQNLGCHNRSKRYHRADSLNAAQGIRIEPAENLTCARGALNRRDLALRSIPHSAGGSAV